MQSRGSGCHLIGPIFLQGHIGKNHCQPRIPASCTRAAYQSQNSRYGKDQKKVFHTYQLATHRLLATLALSSICSQFNWMPLATTLVRLIQDGKSSPAKNMAIDESLLRHVLQPVLRIYGWSIPCLSLGYFQKSSLVTKDQAFVRRYTGGGIVEHGHDLTYTLILPAHHPLTTSGTLPSYRAVHQAVAKALTACDIPCKLSSAQPLNDDPSCFLKPVPADVLDSLGHKLAGAAQRRTKQGCLHQGSILLHGPIPASLSAHLIHSFEECLQAQTSESTLTDQEIQSTADLETSRYANREWNFSR